MMPERIIHPLTIQSFIYHIRTEDYMRLEIIFKPLHKIKQSPILDENEASEKTADRATVSCAFRDLIAYHRPIRV